MGSPSVASIISLVANESEKKTPAVCHENVSSFKKALHDSTNLIIGGGDGFSSCGWWCQEKYSSVRVGCVLPMSRLVCFTNKRVSSDHRDSKMIFNVNREFAALVACFLLMTTLCLVDLAGAEGIGFSNFRTAKGQTRDVFYPASNEFSSHTKIRPQLRHGRLKRVITSTLDPEDGLHTPHITLSYHHEGQRILADLHLNERLIPDGHFLRFQNSIEGGSGDIVQNFTKTDIDLCHYQGAIRGKPESSVAISTCEGGINGVIFDGVDTYFIHSGSEGRLQDDHFLFRHDDMLKNATCGYTNESELYNMADLKKYASKWKDDIATKGNGFQRYKRSSSDNVIRGPFNANKHSSYVELVIVVDNKVYKSFGENMKKVHQHCKDLANIVNALYVPLNIFIALVGVVVWNESNEIEFSNDGDVTLKNFLHYRRTKLAVNHPNDNAQLLTKEQFNGGVVGKALKGPICTYEYSGGVSMEHSQVVAIVATTMAHEMGHNFGMEHDSPDCKCQDEKCIMSASSTSVVPRHWSSCSIDQLNVAFSRGMNYCLRNKPIKLFDSPQCGNGFVEPGEQCDCGLAEHCDNTCCDASTCMLRANASCATGECCDLTTCRPKTAGTNCRIAENECDLPEYCTGESEYCPTDVFKRDTQKCDNGNAFCYQGTCRSRSNQCRILWGPSGESSDHCYFKNIDGSRHGNCGFDRINNNYVKCQMEDVYCGMLHCRHLNERLEFGMESVSVLSHSFMNHDGNIVPCRTVIVDLGLQFTDPGLTPNGAKCGRDGEHKMCVNQKCVAVDKLRNEGVGIKCPEDCNGNGVCNSKGNCHCDIGHAPPFCSSPGPGGSLDSGPATNPNSRDGFTRFMFIFFLGVVPFMALFCFVLYYCRDHQFLTGKLSENIMKTNAHKGPAPRPPMSSSPTTSDGGGLPKSTPSSTDDMNSALLKSPSDSDASVINNGMFGKFKGFTLRPLTDNTTPSATLVGPNVAFVHPVSKTTTINIHDLSNNVGAPQRSAPPPPISKGDSLAELHKANGTIGRKSGILGKLQHDAPALPPPNPGSNPRPIISLPVLETSTCTAKELKLQLKPTTATFNSESAPIRAAPSLPAHTTLNTTLSSPPPPPVPIHTDPKLNVKRDGTIRRITSFLKKEDKQPVKLKPMMDKEKLRNIEISAPIPVVDTSNSDSEQHEETKNLVKRAQSMRSPTKKQTNVQTFGSMRSPSGVNRPKSMAGAPRPKSPPPRPPAPPPVLNKNDSINSSGYQTPVATAKSAAENAYDDCEAIEGPLSSVRENESPTGSDNIYSVIDDIPPAAQTIKRSDLTDLNSSDIGMGLLGEIVNEIEKRNGDSIYTASSNLKQKTTRRIVPENNAVDATAVSDSCDYNKSNINATSGGYIRPAAMNAPIARVAPTRSDPSPTAAFSSFKPLATAATVEQKPKSSLASVPPQNRSITVTKSSQPSAGITSSIRNKSQYKSSNPLAETANSASKKSLPPSTTVSPKPKPLSKPPVSKTATPSPANSGVAPKSSRSIVSGSRPEGVAGNSKSNLGSSSTNSTFSYSKSTPVAAITRPSPPTTKTSNIASLQQKFEKNAKASAGKK